MLCTYSQYERYCNQIINPNSHGSAKARPRADDKMLYMQLDTMEHPHYPVDRKDNTHFNEYGARRMAQLVLAEIRNLKLELAERITTKVAP